MTQSSETHEAFMPSSWRAVRAQASRRGRRHRGRSQQAFPAALADPAHAGHPR